MAFVFIRLYRLFVCGFILIGLGLGVVVVIVFVSIHVRARVCVEFECECAWPDACSVYYYYYYLYTLLSLWYIIHNTHIYIILLIFTSPACAVNMCENYYIYYIIIIYIYNNYI